MTLTDYLRQPGQTATALAQKCGVSVSTITRVAAGTQQPSRALMQDIFKHTDGSVTANDIHGIEA